MVFLRISKTVINLYSKTMNRGTKYIYWDLAGGAATVRSLSSFIHYFGILPKSRPDLVDEAYDIYKIKNEEERRSQAEAFIERHHTMWARVKFLGCFDTVSALGFPIKGISSFLNRISFFKHDFHNFKLSKSVENAAHALAIDDKRKTFHPTLWDSEIESHQTLKQVWFSGMHTDVGGGYKEHELSDIPFLWLFRQAELSGLKIYKKDRIEFTPKADGVMHDSMKGWWQSIVYKEKIRSWPASRNDNPVIHQSVIERAEIIKEYTPWILDVDHEVEAVESIEWNDPQG